MSTQIARIYSFLDDYNNGVPIDDRRIDAELDQIITALNQKVIIKSSAPSSPIEGMMWYDSTNKLLKLYRNAAWLTISYYYTISGSEPENPAEGDLWYNSDTHVLAGHDGTSFVIQGAPIGSALQWFTATPPTGWLLCDGSAVSRETYAALYAVIGTAFGTGDGSTTFNLPNLKGRVPVGYNSSDANFDAIAKTGGAATHTLTVAEMPSHDHNLTFYEGGTSGAIPKSNNQDGDAHIVKTAATGGAGAHNNLQPFLVVNFIIKY